MRRSNWTPSIVPGSDWDVYLVVDNLDPLGTVYRETDAQIADLDTVIADLESGQYNDPMCVVAFNTGEGWSKDVSQDIAQKLQRRAAARLEDLSSSLQSFVDRHTPPTRQLKLRLA